MSFGWSREDCIRALHECADDLGHDPSAGEYERWNDAVRPGVAAMRKHFGSWNNAKEAAGMDTVPSGGDK